MQNTTKKPPRYWIKKKINKKITRIYQHVKQKKIMIMMMFLKGISQLVHS